MNNSADATNESEDDMDNCALRYQEVDSSLLDTAVFIKNIQVESNDLILLYIHNNQYMEEARKPDHQKEIIFTVLGLLFVSLSVIVINI